MQRYVAAQGLLLLSGPVVGAGDFRWAAIGAPPIEVVVDGQIDCLDTYLSKSSPEPWDRHVTAE